MVHYKLIGTGVTDANGVAHMTKNASGSTVSGYVGTGAGLMDFVCSVEDPDNVSSTNVSNTYEVEDCIQYDSCTTGTINANWLYASTFSSATSDSTGMLLTNNTGSQKQLVWNKAGTTSDQKDWENPLRIEFEVVEQTGTNYIMIRSDGNSIAPKISNYSTGKMFRIDIQNSQARLFVDGQEVVDPYSYDGTKFAIRIHVDDSATLKIKDFRVYPI